MSTCYYFVNKEKKAQLDELRQMIETERTALIERLTQFGKDRPLTADAIEDVVFALKPALSESQLPSCDDNMEIGTATATKFYWRTDNGFLGLEAVGKYQKVHPECAIENEYGALLSFADFKKSVGGLARA